MDAVAVANLTLSGATVFLFQGATMATAPKCKHCGERHWQREPHVYNPATMSKPITPTIEATVTIRREMYAPTIAEVQRQKEQTFVALAAPVTEMAQPVTKRRGRPRRYGNNAERQRAYRERQGA